MFPKLILKHKSKKNTYFSDIINLCLILFIFLIIVMLYYKYYNKNSINDTNNNSILK